ncbi:MAG: hypothetical protein ACOY4A_05615 [Pseudomonadota bacterium]
MQKKPSNLGLHSGLPPFVSDELDLEQWNRGPKVLGPSIAQQLVRRGKATQAEKKSESNPPD